MNLPNQIIDAHHHLWNPVKSDPDLGYVWLRDIGAAKPFGDPTPIQRDYLIDEFQSEPPERTTLIGSVHLQCDGAIPDPVAETRHIQQISDKNQFPIAIIGFVDLSKSNAEAIIDAHSQFTGFRGVRHILSRLEDLPELCFAPNHFIRDPNWRDQFIILADRGLSFDLQCYPEQMGEVAEFLVHFPGVPVILDHAGSPWDQSESGFKRWRQGMLLLAQLPQVSVKLCGFGMFDASWSAHSIGTMFETLVDLFGWDRLMFASNFPVDKLMRNYRDILLDYAELCAGACSNDVDAFFVGNAKRIYRL